MDKFIARLNIDHYKEALAVASEPEKRQAILRLLAEEEAKLAALERSSSPAATAASPATAGKTVSHFNLTYYRKRLEAETDMVIRQILLRLVAEEEEKVKLAPPQAHEASDDDLSKSTNERNAP